jgi:CDP-glycerol glycerophosphotransferase
MPLLSIVVPVYSVQGYLRECLDSVLQQSFTDIELIAVDDSSPDHSPAILDEYAALDPRVTVVHLPRNVGLGHARNAGLDRATGEYIWFIDSDDWIAAGCLRAIAERLDRLRPDLLLVDHTRVDWLGRHSRSAGRELLARLGTAEQTVRLVQEPKLLTLLTVAWNKVVRREFLRTEGLRFDAGWYEDMPFTFPVLAAADRITSVPRVCYHYRKGRQETITSSTSERHFEVFDQWARVFARLDRLGPRADGHIRRLVFECMLWHLLVVQAEPGRLPAGTRRAYFGLLSAYYRRYAPPSAGIEGMDRATGELRSLPALDRLRRQLIAEDRYVPFRTLRQLRLGLDRGRGAARRGKRRLTGPLRVGRALGRAGVGRAWYEVQRRLPLDEHLAIYAAYWYRGVSCNPAAIDATARRLAPRVRPVWVLDP